jgi:hypothetical protein
MAITSFDENPRFAKKRLVHHKKCLSMLEQGVKAWDDWREKNPKLEPDLHAINFSGADLRGANFHAAYLRNADFWSANFNEANFNQAFFEEADFRDAELKEVILGKRQIIYEAYFTEEHEFCSPLRVVDLSKVKFNGADFRGINLSYANLSSADFKGANLSEADLSAADFSKAAIEEFLDNPYVNVGKAVVKGCIKPE